MSEIPFFTLQQKKIIKEAIERKDTSIFDIPPDTMFFPDWGREVLIQVSQECYQAVLLLSKMNCEVCYKAGDHVIHFDNYGRFTPEGDNYSHYKQYKPIDFCWTVNGDSLTDEELLCRARYYEKKGSAEEMD